jgi:hypothetical protein
MDIIDPYTAWCFDEAVFTWGSHVQAELDGVEGKTSRDVESKRKLIIRRMLGPEQQTKFADPVAMGLVAKD